MDQFSMIASPIPGPGLEMLSASPSGVDFGSVFVNNFTKMCISVVSAIV